ncbi:alanine racemase [Legionella micdadei]|uniref:Alanine racemase n=1 Tax=Legionella micdadei TaxID=451 RepID=A0A098GG13_LEGMI|nr:alanine racemase [Legionella micdadei]ARG97136.1 alanine racemase [Legionella micdadei]ARH00604.1 alanine racemase [Legionella micdadei]KTD29268.1 alanine racemase [Legionella micdadei]NSL17359.1 alanine racemase [Legionella micdadei]CEG61424.1 Alanine racemase [Legionella micdadei]
MARPTRVQIDENALLHNVNKVKHCAPNRKIIAMVKANAYGCGIPAVVPVLEGHVDAFGVACLEEAMAIRALGVRSDCVLFQGVFSADELRVAAAQHFQCVIHQPHQLRWLLSTPLPSKIKLWVKVNTGMHRLGFPPQEIYEVMAALANCPWIDPEIGLMTHLACADEPKNSANQNQMRVFRELNLPEGRFITSIGNSAAILALPNTHADVVRPGIMLYGVSPFAHQTGQELGLIPVMRFVSAISAIHHHPAQARIGYGGTWQTKRPSIIGVVAAGYGDGYPRHIAENTPVSVNGYEAPIVGRVSMDMLTVDLTDCPEVKIGDPVELWGKYIPVETVALSAGTIAYELLCQFSPRVRQDRLLL